MDVKPKSNKLKRLEPKRKRERRAERLALEAARATTANERRRADQALRESGIPRLGTKLILGMIFEGEELPSSVARELDPLARLFR
jgi:hypothetical protein